jgi:hypothetical protein
MSLRVIFDSLSAQPKGLCFQCDRHSQGATKFSDYASRFGSGSPTAPFSEAAASIASAITIGSGANIAKVSSITAPRPQVPADALAYSAGNAPAIRGEPL